MPKRAVFCLGAYRDLFGIGRFVPCFVEALADAGWRVDVLAPFPLYPAWRLERSVPAFSLERDGAVRVTRFAPYVPRHHSAITRGLHEASLARHALGALGRMVEGADLVVAATPPVLSSVCAARAARRNRVPFCLLVYDVVADLALDVFPLWGKMAALPARRLEAGLLEGADLVVTLTDEMERRIVAASGRRAPIAVIPIWADDALLDREPREAAVECRNALGIGAHRPLVGFAGSFARKQHLPEIVNALGAMDDEMTIVFVGEGIERRRVEEAAQRSSGDVRVGTQREGRDLYGFLAACDLAIVPAMTRHGGTGFPSKVANTLAAGCPVLAITAEETELSRLVRSEDLGWVCADLDAESIRGATRRALALDAVEDRRRRCRAYALAHWKRADAMERFLALVNGATR